MKVHTMRCALTALCLGVLAVVSGSVKSEEDPLTFELTMDISNKIYNESLLNPNSTDYKNLFSQVNTTLDSIYGSEDSQTHSFYHFSGMTFSNHSGTVLVNAILVFHTNRTDADNIKDLFMKKVANNEEVNGLKINPTFKQGSVKSEEDPLTFELTMDISNKIYNESLLNPNSTDYKNLFSQVNTTLDSIYGSEDSQTHSFYHFSGMTFSNHSGTVLVNAILVFHTNRTDADNIKDLFMKKVANNEEVNGLKINPTFKQVIQLSNPETSTPPTTHSTTKNNRNTSSANRTTHSTTKNNRNTSSANRTTHSTTKPHNASSSFNQTPISLTPFLRYSASICLLVLISCSF